MNRDRLREQETLDSLKAPPGYVEQVLARLDRYEAEHGNIGWEQPADQLLAEIQEESVDITGWGLGVIQRLDQDDPALAPIFHRLIVAMRLGAVVWRELEEAQKRLGELRRLENSI